MGCALKKGSGGEMDQPGSELNLVLNNIGKQMNRILQNQTKNLETTISHHAKMIRQSLNEQTNYLKTIAENLTKHSIQVSQIKTGQIKNKNEKPIKMTHQSLNVPVQQSLQQKQSIQKNQKNIIEQKKPIKMNEMVSQMPEDQMQKITEIYSRIQKIQLTQFQFIKEHLHPQKNDPILFINKNSNQLQKNCVLELLDNNEKSRVNIDYKDRFLVIPLVKYDKYSKLTMIYPWISDLYQKLSEEAFYGYLHKHISKQQMKVFFSQNLILNTVKMMRFLTQKDQQISIKQILKKFGELSDPTLEFELKKYPQKKKIFIRPQIQNMIQPCQIHEDPQYEILKNMKFRYQYEENGVYYRQIKLMINKIISLTNQHFQPYREQMKKIFTLKQQKLIPEYIQHQIGRKINQNTPQFEDHQLNSNKIVIQNPQIMRIIIKWIQELEDKINIQSLEKNIDNRYYPFITQEGGQVQYLKQYRQQISRKFKQYLIRHKQYKLQKNLEMLQNIEIQIINYIDKNSKSFTYISQNNIEVGLTTYLLSETVQQIAIKRVNQVLHSILSFQKQQREFGKVDYITFSVYDLLRSRCTGSYQKIKKVYDKLKQNTNFKIIRVKNRLTTGNRDFLINMRFKNTPIICELQLGLILETSNINQKQDRLGDFNHFLYQLKRSKYGPLTQAVLLNAHYSQSITFFQQNLKKIKFEKERKMKIQSTKPKICNGEIQIPGFKIQEQQIIFVCHNCLQIKYTKISFLNTYKKMKKEREAQFQYLCGECVINSLQIFDRNKYLLGDFINQYFQQTSQDEVLKNYQFKYNKIMLQIKIKQLDRKIEIFESNLMLLKNQIKLQQLKHKKQQSQKQRRSLMNQLTLKYLSYYLIISTNGRRYIVRKLDKDYFIQSFSSLVSQKYQFLKINQMGIKYVYRLSKQFNYQNNIIKIHNIQELNQRAYINQQKRQFLINNKEKWKQAVCIEGKKGCLLIDATKDQNDKDYDSNLDLFIKRKQIKKFKQSKIQYMDLAFWGFDHKFFLQHLKEIKQIKKLNLSQNDLTDINQIIKGKNILELKLNYNKLQSVIIPIQSLIRLQINHNQLVKVDLSCLINLQILDISNNNIENIKLDKLSKLQQLNLSYNKLKQLTLSNRQCYKLNLYYNELIKLDISKMEKLKELYVDRNQLEQLVLINPQLEILNITYNTLKKVNIQKLTNLKQLLMNYNKLQNLTLINPKLQYLDISQNQLTSVNLKALVDIKYLNLSENKLKQIYLDYPLLETLDVNNNKLQNLDLTKLGKLKRLDANHNAIRKIDTTKLNQIRYIDFNNNKIQQIVLKNGSLQSIDLQYNRIYNIDIDKLLNLKQLIISNNCITNIKIAKQNNPNLQRIKLNNQKSRYEKYFIEQLLTEQQVVRYRQQKQKTKAEDGQILIKLRFYPIIINESFSKMIQTINHQYDKKIRIIDEGQY